MTGKIYIGSSASLGKRLSIYFSPSSMEKKLTKGLSAIYSAILKYNQSNFSLYIMEYCEPELLIYREQYYLDLLDPEYNILKTAMNRLGSKQSESAKLKISLSQMGSKNHNYGKILSYDTRQKIGIKLKSIIRDKTNTRIISAETLEKRRLRTKGVSINIMDKFHNIINSFPTITSAANFIKLAPEQLVDI